MCMEMYKRERLRDDRRAKSLGEREDRERGGEKGREEIVIKGRNICDVGE